MSRLAFPRSRVREPLLALPPLDLHGRADRELVHDEDGARPLVRGDAIPRVREESLLGRVLAFPEEDGESGSLALLPVIQSERDGAQDRRVPFERGLDVRGSDAVTRDLEDVLRAPDEAH